MGEKSNSCSGCFPFLSVKVLSKEKKRKKKSFANSGNENLDRTPPCNLKHELLCTTVIYLFF